MHKDIQVLHFVDPTDKTAGQAWVMTAFIPTAQTHPPSNNTNGLEKDLCSGIIRD